MKVQSLGPRSLKVSLQDITVQDSHGNTVAEPMNGTFVDAAIDSTVSQMWLPTAVCDKLASTLNLTYDSTTDLYILNSSIHQELLDSNPTFTFKLGATSDSNFATEIPLPYAALNLAADMPLYNVSTPYFPIRRAAHDDQITLGRAFLQKAYLVVDWEREHFTIGPSSANSNTYDVRTIPSISQGQSSSSGKADSTKTTRPGTIAGVVVGAVMCLALILAAIWYCQRRRTKARHLATVQEKDITNSDIAELPDKRAVSAEAMSSDVFQLHEQPMKHLAMSDERYELQGTSAELELDARGIGMRHG